ncbi:acyltransferase [Panacibacter sp. DH6]|uniref:Acyltransferase n=1 Tax=Panacibacter microcysteis TaxID=2793269 RepID=A0A931E9L9_9BACT|nr:acyltransferase [Panacibacter microcysteis]MBG9376704.1 acyltransferase [Panacibacter microcysteis]
MYKYIKQLYAVQGSGIGKVYPGLNAAKGTLILLVIFTHSLPDGMLLYFNYFFHMPVFLAVSGYLLKASAFKYGLRSYLKRLTQRLFIPWLIASLLYLPFSLRGRSLYELTPTDLLYPFFHLWYVPAYFMGAMLCYVVTRFKIPVKPLVFLTGCITICWYIFYRDNQLPVSEQPLYWFGEKRLYAYLFFFLTGFSLRNELVKFFPHPLFLLATIVIAFTSIVVFVYSHVPDLATVIPYMIFNSSLVLFLLIYAAPQNWFQNKLILLTNKQSLGIYLYHPMIIFIIYRIIGDPEKKHATNLQGFGVGLLTLATILTLVWLIQKWSFTNRYLLGIVKETKEPVLKVVNIATT